MAIRSQTFYINLLNPIIFHLFSAKTHLMPFLNDVFGRFNV